MSYVNRYMGTFQFTHVWVCGNIYVLCANHLGIEERLEAKLRRWHPCVRNWRTFGEGAENRYTKDEEVWALHCILRGDILSFISPLFGGLRSLPFFWSCRGHQMEASLVSFLYFLDKSTHLANGKCSGMLNYFVVSAVSTYSNLASILLALSVP